MPDNNRKEEMERYAILVLSVSDEDPASPEAHIRDCEKYIDSVGGEVFTVYRDANIFNCETSRYEYRRFVNDILDNKFDAVISTGSCPLQDKLKRIMQSTHELSAEGIDSFIIVEIVMNLVKVEAQLLLDRQKDLLVKDIVGNKFSTAMVIPSHPAQSDTAHPPTHHPVETVKVSKKRLSDLFI